MADPVTITTDLAALADTATAADSTAQSLNNMANAGSQVQDIMGTMSQVLKGVQGRFADLNTSMGAWGYSLNQSKVLTAQQTTQFGLLATAVLGTKKAFEGVGDIDSKNLITFSGQVGYLFDNLGNSSSALGALVNTIQNSFGVIVPESAKKSKEALQGFVGNLITSADNANKLQNIYLQLGARTGSLNDIYRNAGPNLKNINVLLAQQNEIMRQAQNSTGQTREDIEKFYVALGNVPKALTATVGGTENVNNRMSMLTATIKLATGTGRDYNEIVKDLQTAFRDYGLTGEQALLFTSRFSEISNKFGVELSDVRGELLKSADAFKIFADTGNSAARASESLAGINNDYVDALKNTGMSGQRALETITQLTGSVANLRIEQKAFLSAQTGGPGGLMGAFQIEQMLKDGKIDQVFEKVRATMQKQFGRIVTLSDATASQAGAAQLEKQILLLQNGPLGSLVKNPQDAIRVLDAFKAKQDGKSPADLGAAGLDARGLQNSINQGTSIEEKSFTQLSAIRNNLDAIRRVSDVSNLGLTQQAFSASAGGGRLGSETEAQRDSRANLKNMMNQADIAGGKGMQDSGRIAADTINQFKDWFGTIPKSLTSSMDVVKQAITTGNNQDADQALDQMRKEIENKRAEIKNNSKNMSKEQLAKEMNKLNAEEKLNSQTSALLNNARNFDPTQDNMQNAISQASATNRNTPVASGNTAIINPNNNSSQPTTQHINVSVTGYCLKCKREIEGGDQAHSTTPASHVSP